MNIGIECGSNYSAVEFKKMDGDVAVTVCTLSGEPADAFIALLRVARAFKETKRMVWDEKNERTRVVSGEFVKEYFEALKEVEHLL